MTGVVKHSFGSNENVDQAVRIWSEERFEEWVAFRSSSSSHRYGKIGLLDRTYAMMTHMPSNQFLQQLANDRESLTHGEWTWLTLLYGGREQGSWMGRLRDLYFCLQDPLRRPDGIQFALGPTIETFVTDVFFRISLLPELEYHHFDLDHTAEALFGMYRSMWDAIKAPSYRELAIDRNASDLLLQLSMRDSENVAPDVRQAKIAQGLYLRLTKLMLASYPTYPFQITRKMMKVASRNPPRFEVLIEWSLIAPVQLWVDRDPSSPEIYFFVIVSAAQPPNSRNILRIEGIYFEAIYSRLELSQELDRVFWTNDKVTPVIEEIQYFVEYGVGFQESTYAYLPAKFIEALRSNRPAQKSARSIVLREDWN